MQAALRALARVFMRGCFPSVKQLPTAQLAALGQKGYTVKTAASATLSAVAFDPRTSATRGAMR